MEEEEEAGISTTTVPEEDGDDKVPTDEAVPDLLNNVAGCVPCVMQILPPIERQEGEFPYT